MQYCCIFWGYYFKKTFCVEKLRQLEKNACSTLETKQKCIITHALTNLKSWNSINPWFVGFLRLPLSIQKYLIAYYTILYNFSFPIHKNCANFSLGIRMKDSLNETILALLASMRLPCWKMCIPSAGTRYSQNLKESSDMICVTSWGFLKYCYTKLRKKGYAKKTKEQCWFIYKFVCVISKDNNSLSRL